jgi:predicted TIM-barrel fold metal-dependent hydrolase
VNAEGTPAPRIDAHVHLSAWWPEVRRTGYRPDLDFSVRGLLREMDECGFSHALVLQLPFAPSEEAALAEGRSLSAQSGHRLLPVATVDPTLGTASVAASLARLEEGERVFGIKLYPGYRPFYPGDSRLDPVYELAKRTQLPVLLHQGDTLDGRGLLKFARPIEVDEVAGRFPDVRFVLCHLGNPWIDEAAEVVYKNPNVYADTSGLLPPPTSPYFSRALQSARARLVEAVVGIGLPERFLFGSDWPLTSLATAAGLIGEADLSSDHRAAILGENLLRLLRVQALPSA